MSWSDPVWSVLQSECRLATHLVQSLDLSMVYRLEHPLDCHSGLLMVIHLVSDLERMTECRSGCYLERTTEYRSGCHSEKAMEIQTVHELDCQSGLLTVIHWVSDLERMTECRSDCYSEKPMEIPTVHELDLSMG